MNRRMYPNGTKRMFAGACALAAMLFFGTVKTSEAADYVSIEIYPEHVGLFVDIGKQQFVAFGVTAAGARVNITEQVDWWAVPAKAGGENVVTINESGVATLIPGKTYGQARITCTYPKEQKADAQPAVNYLLLKNRR